MDYGALGIQAPKSCCGDPTPVELVGQRKRTLSLLNIPVPAHATPDFAVGK